LRIVDFHTVSLKSPNLKRGLFRDKRNLQNTIATKQICLKNYTLATIVKWFTQSNDVGSKRRLK